MPDNYIGHRRFCTSCGSEIRPETQFCSTCGAAVLPPPTRAEQIIPKQVAASQAPSQSRKFLWARALVVLAVLLVGTGAFATVVFQGGLGLLSSSEPRPPKSQGTGEAANNPEETYVGGVNPDEVEDTRPVQETKPSLATLSISPEDFEIQWNDTVARDVYLVPIEVEPDESGTFGDGIVPDMNTYMSGELDLLGTVDMSGQNVVEAQIAWTPPSEGSRPNDSEVVGSWRAMIATLNPELSSTERESILAELSVFDTRYDDLDELNMDTVEGNIKYSISPAEEGGIDFTASPAGDEAEETSGQSSDSAEEQVEAFVFEYYDAVAQQNWEATYSLLAEASQEEFTEDEWIESQELREATDGGFASLESTEIETADGTGAIVSLSFSDGTTGRTTLNYSIEEQEWRRYLTEEDVSYLRGLIKENTNGLDEGAIRLGEPHDPCPGLLSEEGYEMAEEYTTVSCEYGTTNFDGLSSENLHVALITIQADDSVVSYDYDLAENLAYYLQIDYGLDMVRVEADIVYPDSSNVTSMGSLSTAFSRQDVELLYNRWTNESGEELPDL